MAYKSSNSQAALCVVLNALSHESLPNLMKIVHKIKSKKKNKGTQKLKWNQKTNKKIKINTFFISSF